MSASSVTSGQNNLSLPPRIDTTTPSPNTSPPVTQKRVLDIRFRSKENTPTAASTKAAIAGAAKAAAEAPVARASIAPERVQTIDSTQVIQVSAGHHRRSSDQLVSLNPSAQQNGHRRVRSDGLVAHNSGAVSLAPLNGRVSTMRSRTPMSAAAGAGVGKAIGQRRPTSQPQAFTYDITHQMSQNAQVLSAGSGKVSSNRHTSSYGNAFAAGGVSLEGRRVRAEQPLAGGGKIRLEGQSTNSEDEEDGICNPHMRNLVQVIIFFVGLWFLVSNAKNH
jgi:hypothetical protein